MVSEDEGDEGEGDEDEGDEDEGDDGAFLRLLL